MVQSTRHHRHHFTLLTVSLLACVLPTQLLIAARKPRAYAVPTFECLGLYYNAGKDLGDVHVAYRKRGDEAWRDGLDLTYDQLDRQYRGSLVGLEPGTRFDVRLTSPAGKIDLSGQTRSEVFSIGETTYLPSGELDQPIRVDKSGTADAWHLVTSKPGDKTTIDVFNLHEHCIEVTVDYVIIRGLELRNAGEHAVRIGKGVRNVIVEDCHITLWGRVGGARVWGVFHGSDSAVFADRGAGGLIVQRNLIENPRSGANDWESGHPDGPQAVTLINSSGGNVIRYNTIRSSDDHGFNDAIGGGSNNSFTGSPNCDSDIYGNIIRNCWDDAIESEGANMNVRIWSNYIDQTFGFVATAVTSKGPLYIYRNVFGRSRITHQDSSGGNIIKTGGRSRYLEMDGKRVPSDIGRRYIFHNTTLQPGGAMDVFSGHGIANAVTRNNIFHVRGNTYPSHTGVGPPNDFKNDLTGSYLGGGFIRSMFRPSERLEWFLTPTKNAIKWGRIKYHRSDKDFAITDPLIQIPNPALNRGARIPGFNDDYDGDAPDIGAFENGRPPLRFGRQAAPDFVRAPWE